MGEYREVPMPQVENPDLNEVRLIAVELAYNHDLHEIAIDSVFKAETYVQEIGKRLLELVGWPDGWKSYEPVPDPRPERDV